MLDWKKLDKDLLYVYPRTGGEKSTLDTMAKFINRFCLKNRFKMEAEDVGERFNKKIINIYLS